LLDELLGMRGWCDDRIRATGVRWGQLGIVTTYLGTRPFGCGHEEQVVNGDDLGGATGRYEQRVCRVNDVERTGQPFGGRPLVPVPEVVQGFDRYAAVDHLRPELGTEARWRTVLPRTGEDRDRIGEALRVGPHQFVHVLAGSRATAHGRAVVDENSHGVGRYDSVSGLYAGPGSSEESASERLQGAE